MAGKLCTDRARIRPDGARGLRGAGAAGGVVAGGVIALAGWWDGAVPRAGGGRGAANPRRRRGARLPSGSACGHARSALECVGATCGSIRSGLGGPAAGKCGFSGAALGWLNGSYTFFALLAGLPLLGLLARWLACARGCLLRSGALVFGGSRNGAAAAAGRGGADRLGGRRAFLAGYGAAPGGAGAAVPRRLPRCRGRGLPSGVGWAASCLLAVFAPSSCWWRVRCAVLGRLRGDARMQAALAGINAAVVGLCWRRCTSRCGPARSTARRISRFRPRGAGRADVVEVAALAGGTAACREVAGEGAGGVARAEGRFAPAGLLHEASRFRRRARGAVSCSSRLPALTSHADRSAPVSDGAPAGRMRPCRHAARRRRLQRPIGACRHSHEALRLRRGWFTPAGAPT